eukprot:7438043-Pyramimonas_sp.AAC.1
MIARRPHTFKDVAATCGFMCVFDGRVGLQSWRQDVAPPTPRARAPVPAPSKVTAGRPNRIQMLPQSPRRTFV